MSFADHYDEYTIKEDKALRKKELEEYMKKQGWIASNLQSAHDVETETVLDYLDNDNKLPSGGYVVTDENFEELLLKSCEQAAEHSKCRLDDIKHAEEDAINEMSEPNSFKKMLDEAFPDKLTVDSRAEDVIADFNNHWDLIQAKVAEISGSPVQHEPPPVPNDNPHIADLVIQDIQEKKQMGIEKYGVPLQAGNGRNALVDAYQEALDMGQYLRQEIEEKREVSIKLHSLRELVADIYYESEDSKIDRHSEEALDILDDILGTS